MATLEGERPVTSAPAGARHTPFVGTKTTPLYIVCSPRRGIGKTLLSRLLIEFYDLDRRAVAPFDLADEGPQLADFMPERTTVADITDISGQMAFFDSLIADSNTVKVIDLSHRIFRNFFVVVQKINFFEEIRRSGVEPIVLFLVDQDPNSAQAYAILQRWFTNVPLLPVRNEAKGLPGRDAFPKVGAVPVSPDMWTLRAMSTALIDKPTFSFAKFWQKAMPNISDSVDDELRSWMKWIFFQFRQIELCQMCEDVLSMIETQGPSLAPTPRDAKSLDPHVA